MSAEGGGGEGAVGAVGGGVSDLGVAGGGGVPGSVEEAESELASLRLALANAEARVRALEGQLAEAGGGGLRRSSSTLADGTTVEMGEAEVEGMRAIFDFFDKDQSGTISTAELQALHRKLGEPLGEEEAEEASNAIDPDGAGEISFPAFMRWWNGRIDLVQSGGRVGLEVVAEKRERWRRQYQERFKFLKARLPSLDVARITTRSEGVFPSLEYRVFFETTGDDGKTHPISPWHDVPLRNADGTYNAVIEIPKWSRAKFEIATGEALNPIKQDTKAGRLRDYVYGDMFTNYGAFPQTWEDPAHVTPETGAVGDNDPIDLVEIGSKQWACGSIVRVKVLGVLALVDSGETDWKVITISAEDRNAEHMDDIEDIERIQPGLLPALTRWLRLYKSHAGIVNRFGFDAKPQPAAFAKKVIDETHQFWKKLIHEKGDKAVLE